MEDFARVVDNVILVRDPKVEPPLVPANDPRLQNVVGVLVTSTAPDSALMARARRIGVWVLAWDGSGFRLTPSSP